MQNILKHLQQAKSEDKLAHAYILDHIQSGTVLDEITRLLGVLDQDILYIEPNNTSISVDQIRQVLDKVSKTPAGNLSVIAIYPAEKMNPQASNALLKCLEEPPGRSLFLLLSHNAKNLLPTIRSRAQILTSYENHLSQYQDHPEYELIKKIYRFNPAVIDDKLLGLSLYKALHSKDPLEAIQAIDGDSEQLIHLTLQIIAAKLIKGDAKWASFDEAMKLCRHYQALKNLNPQAILDRLSLLSQEL